MIICVTGASGFLGRQFIRQLAKSNVVIKVLVRTSSPIFEEDNIQYVVGDLTDPVSLKKFLEGGEILVSIAHPDFSQSYRANLHWASLMASTVNLSSIRRVVHISTATVVGKTGSELIDEATGCNPGDCYERSKLQAERYFSDTLDTELVILRPTEIVGVGGKNLVKLINDLTVESRLKSYFRLFFSGSRKMNLVSVIDVARAIQFFVYTPLAEKQSIYIVSDSRYSSLNYSSIHALVAHELGFKRFKKIPSLHRSLLSIMLYIRGRSQYNSAAIYSGDSICDAGFQFTDNLVDRISEVVQSCDERQL